MWEVREGFPEDSTWEHSGEGHLSLCNRVRLGMFQSVKRHQSVKCSLAWLEQRACRGQEARDRALEEEGTRAGGAL